MHQFSIEANALVGGRPTPEGRHRDGVDFVVIAMVERVNVIGGSTIISDANGCVLAEFPMLEPLDMVFLDDRRLYHEVSVIQPKNPDRPAYRDVLVHL